MWKPASWISSATVSAAMYRPPESWSPRRTVSSTSEATAVCVFSSGRKSLFARMPLRPGWVPVASAVPLTMVVLTKTG